MVKPAKIKFKSHKHMEFCVLLCFVDFQIERVSEQPPRFDLLDALSIVLI